MALRRGVLEPLAVGRMDSSSSTEPSPSTPTLLTESGKFVIGAFEIGRDGVKESQPAAAKSGLASHHAADSSDDTAARVEDDEPPPTLPAAIDFRELQMLQIIGRGASGFVRRAEHVPSGKMSTLRPVETMGQIALSHMRRTAPLAHSPNNNVRHLHV